MNTDFVFGVLGIGAADEVHHFTDGFAVSLVKPHDLTLDQVEKIRRGVGVADVTVSADEDGGIVVRVHKAVDAALAVANDLTKAAQRAKTFVIVGDSANAVPKSVESVVDRCGEVLCHTLPSGKCALQLEMVDSRLHVLCALNSDVRVSHDDLHIVGAHVAKDKGVVSICNYKGRLGIIVVFPRPSKKRSRDS